MLATASLPRVALILPDVDEELRLLRPAGDAKLPTEVCCCCCWLGEEKDERMLPERANGDDCEAGAPDRLDDADGPPGPPRDGRAVEIAGNAVIVQ